MYDGDIKSLSVNVPSLNLNSSCVSFFSLLSLFIVLPPYVKKFFLALKKVNNMFFVSSLLSISIAIFPHLERHSLILKNFSYQLFQLKYFFFCL